MPRIGNGHAYRVTGIPLSPPSPHLAGAKIGDTIELELARAEENALIDAGALVRLPDPKPEGKNASAKSDS